MRILLVLCLFLVFNCEDKQTSKEKQVTTKVSEDKIIKKNKNNNRELPRLNNKNIIDFFLKYDKENKEDKVRITTDFGVIDIQLYTKTRFHRANFIFLTKQKYFNGTQFYRVVKDFVIQGGNSDGIDIMKRRRKIGDYLLPPDTKRGYKHNRGVISMPSGEIENAYKLASPYQFFIVQRQGGAHYLNKEYTAFGEVIKGMDVVDKIADVDTDKGDWPLKNVYIRKVEIID